MKLNTYHLQLQLKPIETLPEEEQSREEQDPSLLSLFSLCSQAHSSIEWRHTHTGLHSTLLALSQSQPRFIIGESLSLIHI